MNGLDNKLTIAIDIDNTLIVHKGVVPNMIVKVQSGLINRKEKKNVRLLESEWMDDGLFEATPQEDDEECVKVIRRLAEAGHKVVVLSSRPAVAPVKYLTEMSLEKHLIPYHKLVLNCVNKAEYCKENDIDVLIDDNEITCQRVISKNPEMLVVNFAKGQDGGLAYEKSDDWSFIYDKIQERSDLMQNVAL